MLNWNIKQMENQVSDFDSIRPYHDSEVSEVVNRLVCESGFIKTIKYFFPEAPVDTIVDNLKQVSSIKEFQLSFIIKLVSKIEKNSITSFSMSGLENIDPDKGYVFISNHRDIILDSALLNTHLALAGRETSEIAIGSNLLIFPWITDMVKLNRTFVVHRNISVKELYESSMLLSRYIDYTIKQKKVSVWIAQREGRTKDGNDKTQVSILKMFNMAAKGDVIENLKSLNLVPMTISYEYDSVDISKVIERYNKMTNPGFKKSKRDDVMGMGNGLLFQKGRVHIHLGKPLESDFAQMEKCANNNIAYEKAAEIIDKRIYQGYKLYPINYVAADIVSGGNRRCNYYTAAEKLSAEEYFAKQSKYFEGDVQKQKEMLIAIYANPVFNVEKYC